ncbi:HdeD family acid-resistance protein [Demequina sp. NBRC 110052]|uniref:HdeD family acid-resistance protein n=1 Tax=Demequina sp. NBRC 110052 TaxID=1570341 RepID=UPI0009FF587F|nr:DUF308 domain-containing protein [Demequina sp. NBRC 110052]
MNDGPDETPSQRRMFMAVAMPLEDSPPPPALVRAMSWIIGLAAGFSFALGFVLLVWPAATLKVGAALIAINFLLSGVLRIVISIMRSGYSGAMRAVGLIFGVLLLIGGVVMLRNLAASATVLILITTIVVGLGWIIEGIISLVDSHSARSRGWAIALGALSIVAGLVVVAIPGWSAAIFLWFAAIMLMVLGVLGLVRAFSLRRSLKDA